MYIYILRARRARAGRGFGVWCLMFGVWCWLLILFKKNKGPINGHNKSVDKNALIDNRTDIIKKYVGVWCLVFGVW